MFASEPEVPDWIPPWVHELGTAAWMCDLHGNVTFMNDRARQLFGSRAETCERILCHWLVQGTDVRGERVCRPNCSVLECARQGEPLEPLTLQSGGPGGLWLQILSIPLTPPDQGAAWLVHCACDVDRSERVAGYLHRVAGRSARDPGALDGPGRLLSLSAREREILGLLARDLDQKAIARQLFLSYATVRNHVQHILAKLHAHSIGEAIARYLLTERASWSQDQEHDALTGNG